MGSVAMTTPSPKSPPKYPDMCGRRRLQLEVQILNREIGFLQDELQSLDGIQPVSRCCKEVNEFVGTKPDPLIPINKRKQKSCRVWRWMRSKFSCCISSTFCLNKPPNCTCVQSKNCGECSSCECTCSNYTCPKSSCCCSNSCKPNCSCPNYCNSCHAWSCDCGCLKCLRDECCCCCCDVDCSCFKSLFCCGKSNCGKSSCCKSSCCKSCRAPSCPECSCGCVWSCPSCMEICRCIRRSNPCCISSCFC